jgi:diacylglycerol kinase (ATP)
MMSPFGPMSVIAQIDGPATLRDLPALRQTLDATRLEYRVDLVDAPGDGARLAREALSRGCRFLVAFGNDAAVQDVINGLFADDGRAARDDVVLGVVPSGAGCDLVRSFGLPEDVEAACRHLEGEDTYPLDVMKITSMSEEAERITRYAANLAEVGMGAEVARRLGGTTPVGRARRFRSFWAGWLRSKPVRVEVAADQKSWEGQAYNVIVGNGQFTGGLRMSPRSFPGDGVLDALVFHGPRSDAYTLLPRIFRHGDHIPDPHIHEMRAKIRIAVDAERPLPVVADGVAFGTTPVTFQVVPNQLRLKL